MSQLKHSIKTPRNWALAAIAVDTYDGLYDACTWRDQHSGVELSIRQVSYQEEWYELHSTYSGMLVKAGPRDVVIQSMMHRIAVIDVTSCWLADIANDWSTIIDHGPTIVLQRESGPEHRIILEDTGQYHTQGDGVCWSELSPMLQMIVAQEKKEVV